MPAGPSPAHPRTRGTARLASTVRLASAAPDTEDDEAVRAYLRRTLASYCHPVGTCRMGEGPLSAVGPDLRVHGIEGLRITDASVFPSIPSLYTIATVYAAAERAADPLRTHR
ncbi:GMC oxidoreductase [Streptomyces sp. NPDC007100]|uniref:GMC oxidoreductase n=1 Tax=Streptomyces sp. NPDC007100 TaxID=3155602 RepID=UPI00340939F6